MPFDDPAAQQRERGHAQPARKEIFHHGEAVEGVWAQQRDIGFEIASRGIEIFAGKMRVLRKEIRGEPHRSAVRRRPFAERGDKPVGDDGQGLAGLDHVPLGQHEAGLRTEVGRTGAGAARRSLRHAGPAGRQGQAEPIGAERLGEVQVPLTLAAQVHAFGTDMAHCLAGSHEAQVARLFRRIVDEALVGGRQRHRSGRQEPRRNHDAPRLRRSGILLDFKGDVLSGFIPRPALGSRDQPVQMQTGSKGQSDGFLPFRQIDDHAIGHGQDMTVGLDPDEQLMMPDRRAVRRSRAGCGGYSGNRRVER